VFQFSGVAVQDNQSSLWLVTRG